MKKNFGDLHKLRLIKFDSGDIKESNVFKGKLRKPSHYQAQNFKKNLDCSTNGFNGLCLKWVRTKSTSETSFKEELSRKRRNSKIFKSQSNPSKRPITKRSISLYNLKQHFSSTNFLKTNPINRSLKTVTEKSLKRKQAKVDPYNKTDVHVLFMSETRKHAQKNIKPNICDDKRKLDWINNSKSSNFFSFKSNQHHGNKNYQSHKNNNRLFTYFNHNIQSLCKFKQYKENIRDPVRIDDRTLNLMSNPYGNTMPMRYNLVDFSCAECNIDCPYSCIHKISTIDTSPCLSKHVWVATNCLDIPKNVSGDLDNFSGKMLTPNLEINNTDRTKNISHNKIQEIENCKRCLYKVLRGLPLFSQNSIKNPESLAKFILKYFLFMIAVIIWSPCILLMCFYWLVTYPAGPLKILEKKNTSKRNLSRYIGCGCNCCQPILNLFAKIFVKVNSSYNTLFSVIKKNKKQEFQHLKTCTFGSSSKNKCFIKNNRGLCPNPKNKYTLSYSLHRGWTMKPLKKRQRFIDKQCEYKMSNVVSQKTSPEPNISNGLLPGISNKDACTMPPHGLISNKNCHHEPFRNRSPDPDRCSENNVKNLQIKPRKNVSFEGSQPQTLDPSGSRKIQIMSPRLNVDSPFSPNTVHEENVQIDTFNKTIKESSPCTCQLIKNVSTDIRSIRPVPIPSEQNPVSSKHTSTEKRKTVSRPNNKRRVVYRTYESKGKKLKKKKKVVCWCKSASKNVRQIVHDVECEVWKCHWCKDTYIQTLRKTPCLWVYRRWPSFYPYFLIFYRFYENVVVGLMFIISTCIWVPILCWSYICFSLFCRCYKC